MPAVLTEAEQEEHHTRHPPLPGHRDHFCTDLPCLLALVACLGLIGYIGHYANEHGDHRKISRGYNSAKELCGVDNDAPLLFWCRDNSTQNIDVSNPVCIHACPTEETLLDSSAFCNGSYVAYPAQTVGNWCLPHGHANVAKVLEAISGQFATHAVTFWRDVRSIGPLMLPAVLGSSIALGYMYLFLMNECAETLVKLCQLFLVGGSLGLGGFCLDVFIKGKATAYAELVGLTGVALVSIGVFLFILFCCHTKHMGIAVGCIEAACECIVEEPTLLVEPLVAIVSMLFSLVTMVVLISMLVSTGEVELIGACGVRRTFTYTDEQWAYLGVAVFMMLWLMELCKSLSQYVLAWTTQMWYFTPYVHGKKMDKKHCGIIQGYVHAFRYHLGTLAMGSFIITYLRALRIACAVIARFSRAEGNKVLACIAKACFCCLTCLQEWVAYLTKNAYMDVAISSSTFCAGARRATELLTNEVPAVAVLHGCQFIFQICGVGMITSVNVWMTLVATSNLVIFTDETSPYFVTGTLYVTVAAGLMSGSIAVCFMTVFDVVGDTILYCFASEQRRRSQIDVKAYSDKKKEADSGFYSWMFGGEEADASSSDDDIAYAPKKLKSLIVSNPAV